jgi:hypothetical protein
VALLLRDRTLLLAAIIILVAPLPVNFITYRGFFVMYVPLIGWALYFGTLLSRWAQTMPARIAVFATTAAVLFVVQSHDRFWTFDRVDPHQHMIRALHRDLAEIGAAVPKEGRVLFLRDAFEPDRWDPVFVVRLMYKDPFLTVDRIKTNPAAQPDQYNLVLDYDGGRYFTTRIVQKSAARSEFAR